MKTVCLRNLIALATIVAVPSLISAQSPNPDEVLKVAGGGTFAKAKILSGMDKLAVVQSSIYFKTATTREILENERGGLLGGRKSGGGSVAGRLTAYLETTDGELTEAEYQEMADSFYKYFGEKLKAAGVTQTEWSRITGSEFYKNDGIDITEIRKDMEQMKKKGQIYTMVNANNGNSLWRYSITGGMSPGFAFGKGMRAVKFSQEMGPVIYMHLVVDFADIWLDGDVSTGTKDESNMFYTKVTTTKKWKMDAKVGADVKVSTTGMSMMYDGNRVENLTIAQDIHSNIPFASGVSQDANKEVLRKKDNIFAKDFNMTPMVVSTTKAQYKAAAKKALENFADTFVAKVQASKK